jgi:hypothetical protein
LKQRVLRRICVRNRLALTNANTTAVDVAVQNRKRRIEIVGRSARLLVN